MQSKFWITSLVLCVLLTRGASAGLIVYEGFERGATGLDVSGAGGGLGFSSIWSPGGFNASQSTNYDIGASSLSFGGLPTSGRSGTTASTLSIAGLRRPLLQSIGPSETFYMSVLLRPEGTVGQGAFNGFFGLYLDSINGDANDLFLGKTGNGNQYSLETRGGAGSVMSNITAVSGQTSMLILKGEMQSGNDIFTLWVNRPLGSSEPLTNDAVKTDLDLNSFNAIVLYSTGAFSIDEIRIGQTFADVTAVPEPSSLLLAGACAPGLLIAARRRWKSLIGSKAL
ncbi:MAG: PEP-CTERM sorting domain-containing protein [Pirellulales bacterium]